MYPSCTVVRYTHAQNVNAENESERLLSACMRSVALSFRRAI
jgi:hypothetical protein